jgi:hypothetical protein
MHAAMPAAPNGFFCQNESLVNCKKNADVMKLAPHEQQPKGRSWNQKLAAFSIG